MLFTKRSVMQAGSWTTENYHVVPGMSEVSNFLREERDRTVPLMPSKFKTWRLKILKRPLIDIVRR